VEDWAHLSVQEGDGGVVVGQVLADDGRRARPGGQALVAADQVAVVERVLRQEVWRQRRLGGVVMVVIGPRGQARIVRGVEGDVAEERLAPRVSGQERSGPGGG